MAAGSFVTSILPSQGGLRIDRLYAAARLPLPPAPGKVGLCLSGGGSRALTAGMGQMRAPLHLQANGGPLLGQLRALSTVSGGSWVGVPFIFLPDTAASDTDYLGPYVADQAGLTLAQLAALPDGNAGLPITDPGFGPVMLALEALLLADLVGVPADRLWQTLVGMHILKPHGLSDPGEALVPTDTFTLDAVTLAEGVTDPAASPPLNPAIAEEPIRCFAAGPGRVARPYLICNAAMLLGGQVPPELAAVQSGGLLTGILGAPRGTDANGQRVGGGGVTSFAFNSALAAKAGNTATIGQARQWSLTDAVGTSSAFFADALQAKLDAWRQDADRLKADVQASLDTLRDWVLKHLPPRHHFALLGRLESLAIADLAGFAALHARLFELPDPVPLYDYWSPTAAVPVANPVRSQFTDGGSLENTGIAGMLAYGDVDRLIACVNSMVPLAATACGVSDGQGGFVPGTEVLVDECIPPLFGYRPHGDAGQPGYAPYGSGGPSEYPVYANNQVFPAEAFPALLQGLAAAAGAGFTANGAIFLQQLEVLPNAWFGIDGGRSVTVLWNYLNYSAAWAAQFADNAAVRQLVEAQHQASNFPNYDTIDTQLDARQVNLLSHLTSWSMVQRADLVTALFDEPAA